MGLLPCEKICANSHVLCYSSGGHRLELAQDHVDVRSNDCVISKRIHESVRVLKEAVKTVHVPIELLVLPKPSLVFLNE